MAAADPEAASLSEIAQEIEQLTPPQLLRLESFARWRMAGLGGLARGRDAEDLLHEAMMKALDGSRTWPKEKVEFVHYLQASMRSISDGWGRRKDATEVLEIDLHPSDPDERVEDPIGSLDPSAASQEDQAIARQAIEGLEAGVADDPIAMEVLSAIQIGIDGPETKELLEISETQLQTARRKIARHARALQSKFASAAERRE